jgi:hypothetical protein
MNSTNCKRNDGFGSQYQNIIWAIMYSEKMGLNFYYTPFSEMEHNYDNDPDFILKKENLINILGNYPTINELPIGENVLELCGRVNRVSFDFIENNLTEALKLNSFVKIKSIFHENKIPIFDDNIMNIAVHIRKKNIFDNSNAGYHHDSYFIDLINHIRENYNGEKKFHIYSQGELESFNAFKNDDVVLHINEAIETTFYGMVTANILIMSKSSLSYVAAMLNEGIVYYLPFWHKPASNWLIR